MTNIQFLREKFDLIPGVLSKKPCKVEYAISACWIFKRELLDKIGFFDEKVFTARKMLSFVQESGKMVIKSGIIRKQKSFIFAKDYQEREY